MRWDVLNNFVRSKAALWIAFIWGLSEATLFFVVPDVFFVLTTFISPLHGITHGLLSVLGSFFGGIIMYLLTLQFGNAMYSLLDTIPLISAQ